MQGSPENYMVQGFNIMSAVKFLASYIKYFSIYSFEKKEPSSHFGTMFFF